VTVAAFLLGAAAGAIVLLIAARVFGIRFGRGPCHGAAHEPSLQFRIGPVSDVRPSRPSPKE
jgi:hypothetical protein